THRLYTTLFRSQLRYNLAGHDCLYEKETNSPYTCYPGTGRRRSPRSQSLCHRYFASPFSATWKQTHPTSCPRRRGELENKRSITLRPKGKKFTCPFLKNRYALCGYWLNHDQPGAG